MHGVGRDGRRHLAGVRRVESLRLLPVQLAEHVERLHANETRGVDADTRVAQDGHHHLVAFQQHDAHAVQLHVPLLLSAGDIVHRCEQLAQRARLEERPLCVVANGALHQQLAGRREDERCVRRRARCGEPRQRAGHGVAQFEEFLHST